MEPLTATLGTERLVDLPQGTVRVFEQGEGEPIVFVHGLFANALAWRKLIPLLAGRFRCVTADWPFGSHRHPMHPDADLSPAGVAATVADVLDALALENVTLVGNDGGGMLAQLVAVHRPERVGRLVLTPCDAFENFPPKMFAYLSWLARIPGAVALLAHLLRIRALRRLPNAYGWLSHTRIEDAVLDDYLAPLARHGIRRDAVKALRAVSRRYSIDAAASFPAFARPVLVAWAQDDRFFPMAHAERLAQDFPDARLHTIPGSRTYVAEDRPDLTAELIADFITSTPRIRTC